MMEKIVNFLLRQQHLTDRHHGSTSQPSPPSPAGKMNDLMTDSFVAAAAKALHAGAPASSAGGGDPELRAFLAEADAAKAEMAALRDELSRLRTAHEASRNAVAVGSGGGRAATQAALVQLLGSARRLRARLASMDWRAPGPAAVQAAAGRDGNA